MGVIKNDMLNNEVDNLIDSYDMSISNEDMPIINNKEEYEAEARTYAYYQEQRKNDEELGSFIWDNKPNFNSKATPWGCLISILFEAGIGLLLCLIFSNL